MEDEFLSVAQLQAIKRVEAPDDLVGAVSFLGTMTMLAWLTGQTSTSTVAGQPNLAAWFSAARPA